MSISNITFSDILIFIFFLYIYDLFRLLLLKWFTIINYFYRHTSTFHSWASSSDDRGNPIPRIDRNKLIDWFIGRHFNVLEHQYGRRDVMWKRFIRKSTPKNGNKQSSFQICFADKRRRKRTSYAISKPLRSTDIISIAQPFSDAIKIFFFLSRCWMEETKFTFTCNLLKCHFFACGT